MSAFSSAHAALKTAELQFTVVQRLGRRSGEKPPRPVLQQLVKEIVSSQTVGSWGRV